MNIGIIDSAPKIITSGLVLHLDAAQKRSYSGTGTVWTDLSGNGNNGTLVNSPTFNSANGGSIVFDGTNDYVEVPYNSSLAPTTAISFGCVAYLANWNSSGLKKLVSKTESGGYSMAINLPVSKLSGYVFAGGAYLINTYDLSLISSGWHIIMNTFDGRYFKMYLDAVNVSTVDVGSILTIGYSVNNSLIIGAEAGSSNLAAGDYFNGNISTVQIYNRALSAAEVLQNYNATKSRFGL